jgi:hypothetical protein
VFFPSGFEAFGRRTLGKAFGVLVDRATFLDFMAINHNLRGISTEVA